MKLHRVLFLSEYDHRHLPHLALTCSPSLCGLVLRIETPILPACVSPGEPKEKSQLELIIPGERRNLQDSAPEEKGEQRWDSSKTAQGVGRLQDSGAGTSLSSLLLSPPLLSSGRRNLPQTPISHPQLHPQLREFHRGLLREIQMPNKH